MSSMNESEVGLRNETSTGARLLFLLFPGDVYLSKRYVSVQDPKALLSAIT